jgi:hypothetical protein
MTESKLELFFIDGQPSHANVPISLAKELNLKGIYGPSSISWRKEVNFKSPLEYLSNKTQKRVLKAIEYLKEEMHYSIESVDRLTYEDYLEWLEVYDNLMFRKGMETIKLTPKWFTSNPKAKNYGAIFIRDETNKIIGGVLIEKQNNSQISCSYRAHDYLRIKDSSLSAIIEYYIDLYALEHNSKSIIRGTDTNLYGVRLSMGLNDFKLNYNFIPHAKDYTGSYFPRYLIFFKLYEKILTYIYDDKSNGIIPKIYEENELREYTQDISKLIRSSHSS